MPPNAQNLPGVSTAWYSVATSAIAQNITETQSVNIDAQTDFIWMSTAGSATAWDALVKIELGNQLTLMNTPAHLRAVMGAHQVQQGSTGGVGTSGPAVLDIPQRIPASTLINLTFTNLNAAANTIYLSLRGVRILRGVAVQWRTASGQWVNL